MPKYQVVWTRRARLDFEENIIYLLENWTERDARQFTKKVHISNPNNPKQSIRICRI